jgi:tetratricopeptide (TPR) repeat protein
MTQIDPMTPGRRTKVAVSTVLRSALVLALALGAGRPATAQEGASASPEWEAALTAYIQDPVRGRDEILALERSEGTDDLPPLGFLLLGDAHLRKGDYRTAEALFERTAGVDFGPTWEGVSDLGIGLSRLAAGDLAGAEKALDVAVGAGGAGGAVAALARGQLAAAGGRFPAALGDFDRVLEGDDVTRELREATELARAGTLYGSGDYTASAGHHARFAISSHARCYASGCATIATSDSISALRTSSGRSHRSVAATSPAARCVASRERMPNGSTHYRCSKLRLPPVKNRARNPLPMPRSHRHPRHDPWSRSQSERRVMARGHQ